jgi:hypothetical protein
MAKPMPLPHRLVVKNASKIRHVWKFHAVSQAEIQEEDSSTPNGSRVEGSVSVQRAALNSPAKKRHALRVRAVVYKPLRLLREQPC